MARYLAFSNEAVLSKQEVACLKIILTSYRYSGKTFYRVLELCEAGSRSVVRVETSDPALADMVLNHCREQFVAKAVRWLDFLNLHQEPENAEKNS